MIWARRTVPPRSIAWLAFFAAILAAWWQMFAMARMAGVDWIGRVQGPPMASFEAFAPLAAMWALMMAAMMGPVVVPALRAYDDLIRSAGATRAGWAGLLAGYSAIWLAAALVLALAQVALLRRGLVDGLGAATTPVLSGALLVAVGAFQFSRAKAACHGVCHRPMAYFLGRWRPGPMGGLRMGLGLGAFCAGCCWGFMALGFVGGVASLLWMGLATLFMVLEKVPRIGHAVIRPLGAALIAGGVVVLAGALP